MSEATQNNSEVNKFFGFINSIISLAILAAGCCAVVFAIGYGFYLFNHKSDTEKYRVSKEGFSSAQTEKYRIDCQKPGEFGFDREFACEMYIKYFAYEHDLNNSLSSKCATPGLPSFIRKELDCSIVEMHLPNDQVYLEPGQEKDYTSDYVLTPVNRPMPDGMKGKVFALTKKNVVQ